MEILGTQEILGAIADGLGDWRKLAQPLATRYRVADTAVGPRAPSFTVLADPDGNKVCVCTALDRD